MTPLEKRHYYPYFSKNSNNFLHRKKATFLPNLAKNSFCDCQKITILPKGRSTPSSTQYHKILEIRSICLLR